MFYSPLRYPGGKNKLARFIALICLENDLNSHYVEPYAGGASVALHLLFNGYMQQITINDFDRSIYALWYNVINDTDKFCSWIETVEIGMTNWYKQKEIQSNKNKVETFELGCSTFFLNRTNRSGIINGGVIGGVEQKGNYKIDCRFNKIELIKKIERIASFRERINLFNLDALELIKKISNTFKDSNLIYYFDPPYFLKGQSLYMNSYENDDHKLVSDSIKRLENVKWIVSYDNVPQIQLLYKNESQIHYSFNHSAYKPREGKEILFFSSNLSVPPVKDPVKFLF